MQRDIDVPESVHQLVHGLRHKCIENLHYGSEVAELLHGVPLDPLLRRWRLCQAGMPPPLVEEAEEHRPAGEEGGFWYHGASCLSLCPSSPAWPSSGAVPCGAFTQGLGDRLLLVPPSSTQSSPSPPSPPLGSSCDGAEMRSISQHR